ncbi:MAG: biotin/lipoyl-containing protein [Methanobacteriota archaeon]
MRFDLIVDGEAHEVEVVGRGKALRVRIDGAEYRPVAHVSADAVEVRIGPRRRTIRFRGSHALVDGDPHPIVVRERLESIARRPTAGRGPAPAVYVVRPTMPGRVVRVAVRPGARVRRGDVLVVLEAMKMQNEIPAPADGRVRQVLVAEGESIPGDRVIAVLEAT